MKDFILPGYRPENRETSYDSRLARFRLGREVGEIEVGRFISNGNRLDKAKAGSKPQERVLAEWGGKCFILTRKEYLIFLYLVDGDSNAMIAAKAGVVEKCVKFHCTHIFKIFNVKRRSQLIAMGINR
jgi:DNA-binding CsgD family transcriptional regulator